MREARIGWLWLVAIFACAGAAHPGTEAPREPAGCVPGSTQCSDCTDNNSDGRIDMDDPYCRVSGDNDESSFASGVPSDDTNAASALDCWFDLNSGTGDDGCSLHACCMIDGPCPADLQPGLFDANACTPSQGCTESCAPIARTACDCFGCCEVCVGGDCHEVFVHPVVSPGCTLAALGDPTTCRPCARNPGCQSSGIFADGFESDSFDNWSPGTSP